MENQNIFKRYEYKYLITLKQKEELLELMNQYMLPDIYGRSNICNIYYDTPDYLLIRRSLEHGIYKEKLRIRSYGQATDDSEVFIELKKKYQHIVYKRRMATTNNQAMKYLSKHNHLIEDSQINKEIDYALNYYEDLRPSVYISYEREAFYGKEDHEFRLTFDQNILFRNVEMNLCSEIYGMPILNDDEVLMEIKIGNAMPLWLSHFLSSHKIYRTSFSKYGLAYKQMKEAEEYVRNVV